MPGKYHFTSLVPLLLVPSLLYSQESIEPESQVEELLYRDESSEVPFELFEEKIDLVAQPVNLNRATPEQLEASGLFTPFQIHMLLKYRSEFGTLYSVFELAGLTGFRMDRLREIAPYLSVEVGPIPAIRSGGRQLVMINAGKNFPEAAGYSNQDKILAEPAYVGTPVKTSIRIRTHVGRSLTMGLAFEKDPGEKLLNGFRPEFLSKYVSYRGTRFIKQLVLGDFQLQHGLGLVNGSGFMHSPEGFQIHRLPISKLRPFASLSEYRFERGIGCRMERNRFELMIWSSYQQPDLSLSSPPENPDNTDWMKFRRTTGLHRTAGEIKGRSLAYRFYSGIQTVLRYENFTIGSMFGVEVSGLTRKGTDSLKIKAQPFNRNTFSLHGQWHRNGLEVMGELATGDWNSTAFLAGFRVQFNDFLQGLLLLHYYGPSYHGIQPSSYASGSNINNEQGVALLLQSEPGIWFTADFLVELFNYPSRRYLTSVPSTGYRYSLTLKNNPYQGLQWKIKLVKKAWQITTGTHGAGLSSIKTPEVTRLDSRIILGSELKLQWQSRLVISLLSGNSKKTPGYAIVQQIGIRHQPYLKYILQFVVFHVEDWDNRIYLYEPGLYYDFNFPVYYGSGQKISSVVVVKAGGKVAVSVKASMVKYHDRDHTGSGNEMLPGNKKWEAKVQLRLTL